ncbi:MAG TPA: outer membrane beta-barrel protein [Flavisolibacter sp.]
MKRIILTCLASLVLGSVYAQQTISGIITDQQSKTAIASANVQLLSLTDSALLLSLTDSSGSFSFSILKKDSFLLSFSYVGYQKFSRKLFIDSTDMHLEIAAVPATSSELATVIIRTSISPVSQKGDTLQINASQFKVNPDASGEDLVRKVPGITIENGQVKAQGENVQKVTIDGRDLFGDDATAALRNLPAEIIDKIQVFDRLSDQAQVTGFDDGNTTKAINIVTKANMRNGQFGRVYAGYGTENRYQAGGNSTILNDNRRISIVGNFNNVNQQNFSQQDLLGLTSNNRGGGGGRRGNRGGGRGGGGNQGSFGSNGNFLVGQQNGINSTNAMGINFSDVLSNKITLTGSYLFNNTNNNTSETSNQQYFSGNGFNQEENSSARNNNHRINMRLEWKPDSNNQITIIPNLSFQSNDADKIVSTLSYNGSKQISTTTNTTNNTRQGNNLNNTILYRRIFAKRGRSFSINLNTSSNSRKGEVYVNSFRRSFDSLNNPIDRTTNRFTDQDNGGYQVTANIAYTEPLGEKSQLQLNYQPGYTKSMADQEAFRYNPTEEKYNLFDTSLSNRFDNTTRKQNAGISYRYGDRNNQFSIGASYQRNILISEQDFPKDISVRKTFHNILPNAQVRLKLSSRSNIRLFFRSNTNNPSVTQLSDVVDITDRPFITAGNPELRQQFMNILSGRYTFTNTGKGLLIMGNVFYQSAKDYITNASFINEGNADTLIGFNQKHVSLSPGEQLSIPINMNGYNSVRSLVTLAFPVKFIKSNFNLNGGISFSRLPGSINGLTNISRNTTISAGAVIASNVSEYVDFTVSYTANFNNVKNEMQKNLDDQYFQHAASIQLNLLSKNGWFFQNDLNNQLFKGLAQGFNQNYTLWNMSVGKKFLADRKGELKLSVFDLLKQNRSIVRNVTELGIEDVRNEVLQQYFMLTFTYNLRNFPLSR